MKKTIEISRFVREFVTIEIDIPEGSDIESVGYSQFKENDDLNWEPDYDYYPDYGSTIEVS